MDFIHILRTYHNYITVEDSNIYCLEIRRLLNYRRQNSTKQAKWTHQEMLLI